MNVRPLSIARKEIYHISRDPRSLIIIIAMPILMLLLYGYAISFDIRDVPLAVLDRSGSRESGELVRSFVQSGYFRVAGYVETVEDIDGFIRDRKAKAGIVIPSSFSRQTTGEVQIQMLLDGSDPTTANVIINYSEMIVATHSLRHVSRAPPFDVRPRIWYNQELKSVNFIVPGLTALLLMMVSALLTSLSVVREWESGTMERLLTSPVRAGEIIAGKAVPYVVLAFLIGLLILGVGYFHFGVPFSGSPWLLFISMIIYIYCALNLGLLISTAVRTQLVATLLTIMATLLPSILLSGFLFPIPSLPKFLQFVTMLVPARYFLVVIRGVVLKGIGLEYLWPQLAFLLGFALLLFAASVGRFHRRVRKGWEG
ncbi:ABC transporter permease [candidate division KSB1 bacterium]